MLQRGGYRERMVKTVSRFIREIPFAICKGAIESRIPLKLLDIGLAFELTGAVDLTGPLDGQSD